MSEPKSLLPIESGRCGDWFLSLKGRRIWPFDMRPEDIDIEEIAHALGNICRFGGHVRSFYSVAQHSVYVARVLPQELRLAGLLHDAPEAYCNDMVRPIKHSSEMAAFRHMEDGMWNAIAECFGLPVELAPEVKIADSRMLQTERRDLLAPHPWTWTNEQIAGYPQPYDFTVEPIAPDKAALSFLYAFEEAQEVQLAKPVSIPPAGDTDMERLLRSRESSDRSGR